MVGRSLLFCAVTFAALGARFAAGAAVVKSVKTPTMVITGEEDFRTPMSESEQYYAALKILGVESVLVRVPGEPHGIRRRPSHHVAKILEIGAWFEGHRKSPVAGGL